jgi:hypothetical protein
MAANKTFELYIPIVESCKWTHVRGQLWVFPVFGEGGVRMVFEERSKVRSRTRKLTHQGKKD